MNENFTAKIPLEGAVIWNSYTTINIGPVYDSPCFRGFERNSVRVERSPRINWGTEIRLKHSTSVFVPRTSSIYAVSIAGQREQEEIEYGRYWSAVAQTLDMSPDDQSYRGGFSAFVDVHGNYIDISHRRDEVRVFFANKADLDQVRGIEGVAVMKINSRSPSRAKGSVSSVKFRSNSLESTISALEQLGLSNQ